MEKIKWTKKTFPYILLKSGSICLDKRYKKPEKFERIPMGNDFILVYNGKEMDLSTISKMVITIDPEHPISIKVYHMTVLKEKVGGLFRKLLKDIAFYYRRKADAARREKTLGKKVHS